MTFSIQIKPNTQGRQCAFANNVPTLLLPIFDLTVNQITKKKKITNITD